MDLWITQLWITMSKPSIVMKNLMCASIVQQDMPPPCPYLHIVRECTEWIKQVIFDHLINCQIICEFDILFRKLFWHTVRKVCWIWDHQSPHKMRRAEMFSGCTKNSVLFSAASCKKKPLFLVQLEIFLALLISWWLYNHVPKISGDLKVRSSSYGSSVESIL